MQSVNIVCIYYIHICKYNKHRCVLLQTKGACSQSRLWLWKQLKRLKCALNGRLHIRVCIYKYVHINIWVSVLARAICRQLLLVVAVGRWRSCGRAANVWPSNVKSTSIKIQQFRLWLTREVSSSSSSSRNNSGKRLNRHRGISHISTHTWYVFIYTHKHIWIWSSLRAVWLTLKKLNSYSHLLLSMLRCQHFLTPTPLPLARCVVARARQWGS